MSTELNENSRTISADGEYHWSVRPDTQCMVKIKFTAAGTDGTIALKDAQGDAELDPVTPFAAIVATHDDAATTKFMIEPKGGQIQFTAAAVTSGSSVADVYVTQKPAP